ncbi:hypothetical protein [Streptosporangium pseudovulgare]|uniref:DUF5666 domain-containing protein n=1 Tax=Streptosporangium pseudovulgare TaxID=35765 RepID=A0ABQ2R0P6_9ACTN|nr:hypothetical protein [Streptosporangium pseudovulgare]GGQ03999.1 hypothetical protein GCM10010140_37600 [Streptosporangium pseudovulgare]
MNASPKVSRILPAAVLAVGLAAGLTACSGDGDGGESAAPTPAVSATESSAAPETASEPPATALPTVTATLTASPAATPSVSGMRGLDGDLVGDVQLQGSGAITVAPEGEAARQAELMPFTEVLDVQGGICTKGSLPHRCTTDELRKALKAGKSLYAKVTVKDGFAMRIEEIVPD